MTSLNCAEPSVSVVFQCANERCDGKKKQQLTGEYRLVL